MPRKMEPSFEIKKIIWDVAATMGLSNYSAIWREADYQLERNFIKTRIFLKKHQTSEK